MHPATAVKWLHNNLKADFTHYYGLGQRSADLYEVSSKAGSKTSKTTPPTVLPKEFIIYEEMTVHCTPTSINVSLIHCQVVVLDHKLKNLIQLDMPHSS